MTSKGSFSLFLRHQHGAERPTTPYKEWNNDTQLAVQDPRARMAQGQEADGRPLHPCRIYADRGKPSCAAVRRHENRLNRRGGRAVLHPQTP